MTKDEIRIKYKAKRDSVDLCEIRNKSSIIFNKIKLLDEYINATNIFVYINFGNEILTDNFIEDGMSNGKNIFVPKVFGSEMAFFPMNDFSNLKRSKYGILEPNYNNINECKISDENTIIIVPAIVFDKNFYRIGYGGGYYDKYLSKCTYMKTIGVALDFQVIEKLPSNNFDIPVDIIVTENKTLYKNCV